MPLSRNQGTLTSWNPLGLSRPVMGLLYGAFPGGKGGQCVRLTTLPPSCAVVMKSGYLNSLEPSGPVQACSGTALHYTKFWSKYVALQVTFIGPINGCVDGNCILIDTKLLPSHERLLICTFQCSMCSLCTSICHCNGCCQQGIVI